MSVEISEIISQSFSGILGGIVVVAVTWIRETKKTTQTKNAVIRQKLEAILFLSEDSENYIHTERGTVIADYITNLTIRNSVLKGCDTDEILKLESLRRIPDSNPYKTIKLESMIRVYASELNETVTQIRELESQVHRIHVDLIGEIKNIAKPIEDLQQAAVIFLQKTDEIVMELKVKHDQLRHKIGIKLNDTP